MLKYHLTEYGRTVANDAMDIHGGKGIMLGPRNYLARGYDLVPVAITVEGANILTRSLIIFGQGAIRCHPFVLREMNAARDKDKARGLKEFDAALFGHIGFTISNAVRSLVMALTLARFSHVPEPVEAEFAEAQSMRARSMSTQSRMRRGRPKSEHSSRAARTVRPV